MPSHFELLRKLTKDAKELPCFELRQLVEELNKELRKRGCIK